MGGEAGILFLLTIPVAILLVLTGFVVATSIAVGSSPKGGKWATFGRFILWSALLVPISASVAMMISASLNDFWSALLLAPSAGAACFGALIAAASIVTRRNRRRNALGIPKELT